MSTRDFTSHGFAKARPAVAITQHVMFELVVFFQSVSSIALVYFDGSIVLFVVFFAHLMMEF